ncbi:MAG TPA: MFS transporter [Terracidiphilus sp.]|jgi:FHS family glucose/mannose:H+ symporter-like MFS transporter|nr:MFS transporter [Terracidiphilus sp.]
MQSDARHSSAQTLTLLHPVFLLTGILHAIGGPLLPSVASAFHLNDSQSGLLFLLYFAGSSLGAVLCIGSYARIIVVGFVAIVVSCLAVAIVPWPVLLPVFLLLGISVGLPMSAVSLFVGRSFPQRSASVLAFLNMSWSAGALIAPLLAACILVHRTFRTAYLLLGAASAIAAFVCARFLRDAPELPRSGGNLRGAANLRLILVFAFATFLQVGVENTAAAWLSTYMLRIAGSGAVFAATLSTLYWVGFLVSRGFAALVLLYVKPALLLFVSIVIALGAAVLLATAPSVSAGGIAMFLLGIALAPTYPLLIAQSFSRVRQVSDTRWILAASGFGGSVLPWLTGWISSQSGSIRAGIATIPAALLLMFLLLPFLLRLSLWSLNEEPQSQ